MLGLSTLPWLVLLAVIAIYWWQSGLYKGHARKLAQAHCHELGLQLLDHSMVIVGFWPARDDRGRLAFRRRYQFEFASTGNRRYQGLLVLLGMTLESIQLDPYIPPDSD